MFLIRSYFDVPGGFRVVRKFEWSLSLALCLWSEKWRDISLPHSSPFNHLFATFICRLRIS